MLLPVLVVFCVLFALWLRTRRPGNFPPGPPCLPLVGSLLSMPQDHVHITMMEWKYKYGPLVGLMMGSQPLVMACGPSAVREILRRDEFQGRPEGFFFRESSFKKRLGVIFSDGPFWVEQRRFTLRHLRDFGFSKSIMATVMHDEFDELAREMKEQGIVQVSGLFNLSVVNVLWAVVAGHRYSHDDQRLQNVLDRLQRAFRASNPAGNIFTVFPILRHIAPEKSGYSLTKKSVEEIQQMLREIIQEHKNSIDTDHPRDFIDIYLREIAEQSGNDNSSFTDESLIVLCLDLFTAGSETVSNTLGFCLLYMVLYPEVQKAAQDELDNVVGTGDLFLKTAAGVACLILLRDRWTRSVIAVAALDSVVVYGAGFAVGLPYVEAVLAEVTRINGVAPVTAPHRCTEDTYIQGYFIPKGSIVTANLYGLLHDKEHWGDPEVFRPGRFLDNQGNFVRDEWLSIFGLGKRACLGEALARNSLFVFFACLLQEFSFCLPDGDPQPSIWPLSGITNAPQAFKAQVFCRT